MAIHGEVGEVYVAGALMSKQKIGIRLVSGAGGVGGDELGYTGG